MILRVLAIAAAGAFSASAAVAQGGIVCRPGDDSNEAKLFGIRAVAVAFSPAAAPRVPAPGRVELGLELTYLTEIDSLTAVPETCYPGKAADNVNILSVLPRPRILVGLPAGFAFEGSWVPPIRFSGVKANLFGLGLSRPLAIAGGRGLVTPRLHATLGEVHAPVTCPEEVLDDPTSSCFNGTESDDSYQPNQLGVDVSLAWPLGSGFTPYGGIGWEHLDPTFQVNFTNSQGTLDDTKVLVTLERAVVFGGLTWQTDQIRFSGEIWAAPTDAATARLYLSYTLGSQ